MKYTLDDDGRRRVNGEIDFRPPEDSTFNNRTSQTRNTVTGRSSTSASSSHWGLKLVLVALAIFLIAHFYDKSNKSEEEEAINSYMAQQNGLGYTGAQEDGMTADNSVEDVYQDDASDMGYEDDLWAEDAAVIPDAGAIPDAGVVEAVDTDSEYEMPGSDSRYLSEADIAGYDQAGIQLIVNEIYARHGRVFSQPENDSYFRSKSWYHPVEGKTDEQIVSEFNGYEIANVDFLAPYLN